MNYWKNNGAPAEKLLVGFPTYGNTFTLSNPANHGIGAPISGAGTAGKYTQEAGELAYFEVTTPRALRIQKGKTFPVISAAIFWMNIWMAWPPCTSGDHGSVPQLYIYVTTILGFPH